MRLSQVGEVGQVAGEGGGGGVGLSEVGEAGQGRGCLSHVGGGRKRWLETRPRCVWGG